MSHETSILLVDDETAITDNLAPFLSRSGFAVSVAANGEAALEQVPITWLHSSAVQALRSAWLPTGKPLWNRSPR